MSVVSRLTILNCKKCKREERKVFTKAKKNFNYDEPITIGKFDRKLKSKMEDSKVFFAWKKFFVPWCFNRSHSSEALVKVGQLTLQTVTFHRPQPRPANQISECLRRHCKTEGFLLIVNMRVIRDNRKLQQFIAFLVK